MTTIAITGVTGQLGGFVAHRISEAGLPARHLARRPERAPKLAGASLFKASYEHSQEAVAALSGVDVLFMVSAREHPERLRQHKEFIAAAREAGVRHIVYTSFYNASPDSTFTLARDHAATEKYIKQQGLTYTFLRDNFYLDFFVDLAKEYGEIKGPAGQGRVSAVLRSDVAEVAAAVLKNPQKWENQILDMTGPEDLSLAAIAQQCSHVLGKQVVYTEETVSEAYASRKAWPAQQWEYDSWVSTYTAIAAGEQSGLSKDIEHVLGRRPTSLKEYLQTLTQDADPFKNR
ncbi:SDR family oxidoreductase [Streptococcus sp. H49]|uniref:SDR family oxidoreductase n=1 Tax=Streptococcus huangxiaojuni TaxID=3237239 RepID=UPI0034A55164